MKACFGVCGERTYTVGKQACPRCNGPVRRFEIDGHGI